MTFSTSQPLDLQAFRSRLTELRGVYLNSDDIDELSTSEDEKLLKDCAIHLQSKLNQLISEFSDVNSLPAENLGEYVKHVKGELSSVEAEREEISGQIEELSRSCIEHSNLLESNIEALSCSLDLIDAQGFEMVEGDTNICQSLIGDEQHNFLSVDNHGKFKMLELNDQIEKNQIILKSLQDLDDFMKKFEAIEKVEDVLTGVKVIELEGNCIKLSLKTHVQNLENVLFQQKIKDIDQPLEQNHEMLIEFMDGSMELKNVDIFPNDVYVGEIIDTAKSFRHLFSPMPMLETRSYLEWLVRRVQDRIVLCTARQFVVKFANLSRHSFEYLDRGETIVAHIKGGVDAIIECSQGWPVSYSELKLKSLLDSSNHSNEIPLGYLRKVEELANSLDAQVRKNLSSFADAIEEIIATNADRAPI